MGQTTGDLNKDGFNDVMLAGVYFTPGACAYQNCLFGPSGNGLFQNNKNGSFSNIAKNVIINFLLVFKIILHSN